MTPYGEVLQPSDYFCGPPLEPLQQVHVFPVLRGPELDAVLQVRSHQRRVEGQNHLPRPAGCPSLDAAQDTVGFLGCERTLPAHVQLFIHQYPQILLHRAALNPFIPQSVLILGVALTQVQDLTLGLVEPHEVHMGPLLNPVKIPLNGIPSPRHVNHTTQLGVICKLAEGTLDPTVYVIDEDIKQYWSHTSSRNRFSSLNVFGPTQMARLLKSILLVDEFYLIWCSRDSNRLMMMRKCPHLGCQTSVATLLGEVSVAPSAEERGPTWRCGPELRETPSVAPSTVLPATECTGERLFGCEGPLEGSALSLCRVLRAVTCAARRAAGSMSSAEGEERWPFLRFFFNLSWQKPPSLPEGTSRGHCVVSACKKHMMVTEQPLSRKGHQPAALATQEPARRRERAHRLPMATQKSRPFGHSGYSCHCRQAMWKGSTQVPHSFCTILPKPWVQPLAARGRAQMSISSK
ncbi:hypothetical protein QYF61_022286 [Mycteria americana]|uniref:Uncharacterized protein n=1 Tax=Mycteria americana TaxID=33587 RepID=A0AAN7MZK7_MYCAM|nr:hypothetical protein QYF61_022286 [Mycteria americana]